MSCSNIRPFIVRECRNIRPMSLDEKRQLLEREKWINNVIRILGYSRGQAENMWVYIATANYNESIRTN